VATTDATGGARAPAGLGVARRRWGEDVIKGVLGLCALVSVLTTVGIVVALLLPALEFFGEVSPVDYFTGTEWSPLFADPRFGVPPLVIGTLSVTLWACVVALPFGLGAAIYLSEYAPPRVRKWLKPALEVLAGIPTVVFGWFALTAVTPLLRDIGIDVGIFNALAAGLVMGVMLIPTVASLSEDAMSAVPDSLRQGSMAMGANRMQTTLRVVFPAALSGIAAAVVLGMSRAVGETMILLMAGGSIKNMSLDPTEAHETMTGLIARTAMGESPVGSTGYNFLFAVALMLFAITFVMNMISISIVRRFRQVY
jgi:phosphate transport system permease protein